MACMNLSGPVAAPWLGCAGAWAAWQGHVPQPVPPGPYAPVEEPPITVPTPEPMPPQIDEPVPEPTVPIREPGIIRPPQAARRKAPLWRSVRAAGPAAAA